MIEQKISINNKRILFLAPAFFGYELKIKSKMEEMGAQVDFYDVRSVTSSIERALLKISHVFFLKKTSKYYDNIIRNNNFKKYDFVLIVKCDMITSKILKRMRSAFKEAKFYLYLWDSVRNIPGVESKFKYFDRVLSFDRIDSQKYNNVTFRPLFFLDEFKKSEIIEDDFPLKEIDLSFLGTIHSDRYAIINKIEKVCKNTNLNFYTFKYLQSKFIYHVYKVIKREFRNTNERDFSFVKMNVKDISHIVDRSKVILDIEHPKQVGLTMRTIEMIGMNKKIITTNKDIVNYDFYDPENILVISRQNPMIPSSFFENDYKPVKKEVYDKYYIENWINDVLIR